MVKGKGERRRRATERTGRQRRNIEEQKERIKNIIVDTYLRDRETEAEKSVKDMEKEEDEQKAVDDRNERKKDKI